MLDDIAILLSTLTAQNALAFAVIAIAVAQALSILLTLGRERELRRLRELVNQQRIQNARVIEWVNAQPRRMKVEYEPTPNPAQAFTRAELQTVQEVKKPAPVIESTPMPPLAKQPAPVIEPTPMPPPKEDSANAEITAALEEIKRIVLQPLPPVSPRRIVPPPAKAMPSALPPTVVPMVQKPGKKPEVEVPPETEKQPEPPIELKPENLAWRELLPGLPETLTFKQ
jgi:hypothetical protein